MWAKIHPEVREVPFLIDTGAGISLLPYHQYLAIPEEGRPVIEPTGVKVLCGNSTGISVEGTVTLPVIIKHVEYKCVFHVSHDEVKGILGMNFLVPYRGDVGTGRRKLVLNGKEIDIYSVTGQQLNHRVVMERTIVLPPGRRVVAKARIVGKNSLDGQPVLIEGVRSLYRSSGVLVARVIVQPDDRIVPVELHNTTDTAQRVCTNQTLGVLRAVVDAEPWEDGPRSRAKLEANYAKAKPKTPVVPLAPNVEPTAVHVSVNKIYTEDPDHNGFFPAEDRCTWTCESVCAPYDAPPDEFRTSRFLPEHVRELYDRYGGQTLTNPWDQVAFYKLLDEFHDVFAKDKYDLGRATMAEHRIDTGDSAPFRQRPRRLPQAHHAEIEKQVQKLAEVGIVRPSNSNYASNVLLVKKKDETWRMCVDYRELNRKTINKSPYMLPRIDDTLDALSGARYFCTLDLLQGYHQVALSEDSIPKTAFTTPHMTPSLWEYTCMPFGITGGPATFQELMDKVLKGMEYRIALAYLDDIIVFGGTPMEVMDRLAQVFNRIRRAHLKLKASKCTFFERETGFLGHIVSHEGVKCDPKKVAAVESWRRPQTNKQALSFAAFVNYYNRFIPDFSKISAPLYALGRQRTFKWTGEHEEAFQKLKQAVITAPVMAYPQEEGLWILDTDACGYAIGACLSQMQKNDAGVEEERVVAYGSKSLEGRQQRYCTRRRELLAIIHFVKQFRPYLYGREVLIRTDHASLKYIKTMNNPGDQSARWIECLEELYYTIEVRAGAKHCNADALSRLPSDEVHEVCEKCTGKRCVCVGVAELEKEELEMTGALVDNWRMLSAHARPGRPLLAAILVECPPSDPAVTAVVNAFQFTQQWSAADIARSQQTDPDIGAMYLAKSANNGKPTAQVIGALSESAKVYFHDWNRIFLKPNGCLYRRWEAADGILVYNQLLLPHEYREMLFHHLHEAPTAAHMGRRRTLNKIQRKYYWHRMGEDIAIWIRSCLTCQQRSINSRPPRAPMQLALAGEANEKIAMDIMGPFNRSADGNLYILVIVDHFTKYARAVAMRNQKSVTIATALLDHWISIFGTPRQIHTDQGANFDSGLMHELCDLLGVEKTRTTPYHPAGDGQVERQNRTILTMLHAYAADDPAHWDRHISQVLIGYNATRHSVTGFEPNRMQIAFNVSLPIDLIMPADPDVHPRPVNAWVRDRERHIRYMYALARANIQRAATAQKRYYDRRANFKRYQVGDAVMLRVFRHGKGQKYHHHFEGPFYVLKALGETTYRIAENENGRERVIGHDHLRPCYTDGPMDKNWIFERARRDAYRFGQIQDAAAQAGDATPAEERPRPPGDPEAMIAEEEEEKAEEVAAPAAPENDPIDEPVVDTPPAATREVNDAPATGPVAAPQPPNSNQTPDVASASGQPSLTEPKTPFFGHGAKGLPPPADHGSPESSDDAAHRLRNRKVPRPAPRPQRRNPTGRRGRPRKLPPALVNALLTPNPPEALVASAMSNLFIELVDKRYEELRVKWRTRVAAAIGETPENLLPESAEVNEMLWAAASDQVAASNFESGETLEAGVAPLTTPPEWQHTDTTTLVLNEAARILSALKKKDIERVANQNFTKRPSDSRRPRARQPKGASPASTDSETGLSPPRRARPAGRFLHPYSISPRPYGPEVHIASLARKMTDRFVRYRDKWRELRAVHWGIPLDEVSDESWSEHDELNRRTRNDALANGLDGDMPPFKTPKSWRSLSPGSTTRKSPTRPPRPKRRPLVQRYPGLNVPEYWARLKDEKTWKKPLEAAPGGADLLEELSIKRSESYWAKWCELRARKRGVSVSDLSDDEDAVCDDIGWRAAADLWFMKPDGLLSPVETPYTWLTTPASEHDPRDSRHDEFMKGYQENRAEMREKKLLRAKQRKEEAKRASLPRNAAANPLRTATDDAASDTANRGSGTELPTEKLLTKRQRKKQRKLRGRRRRRQESPSFDN